MKTAFDHNKEEIQKVIPAMSYNGGDYASLDSMQMTHGMWFISILEDKTKSTLRQQFIKHNI